MPKAQGTYDSLNAEFEKAVQDYETTMHALEERQQQEREATAAKLSAKVQAAQAARDKFALEIKLKDYPASVKKQKKCEVCGAQMRPFSVSVEGKTEKIWACSAGNLSETHSLIKVE